MNSAHDLTYTSVMDLARLVRERAVSPVELIEMTIARIEERNASLNAFVFLAFDEARRAAAVAEQSVVSGAPLGPLHGVPTAIKDLYDFKPGWPATYGGVPALADNIVDYYCVFAERIEKAGAIIVGKTNSPTMESGAPATTTSSVRRETRSTCQRTAAGLRAAVRPPLPTDWCPSRKGPTRAARSASRPHGAASLGSSHRGGGCRWCCDPTRSRVPAPSSGKARLHDPSLTPRSSCRSCRDTTPATRIASQTRPTSPPRSAVISVESASRIVRTLACMRSTSVSLRLWPRQCERSRTPAPS